MYGRDVDLLLQIAEKSIVEHEYKRACESSAHFLNELSRAGDSRIRAQHDDHGQRSAGVKEEARHSVQANNQRLPPRRAPVSNGNGALREANGTARNSDYAPWGEKGLESNEKLNFRQAHDDYGAEAGKGNSWPTQNGGSAPTPNPETADKAFRAGNTALHAGDPARAVQMLRLASAYCPPDRPLALAKIEKLLALAYASLADRKASPALQAVPEAAEAVRPPDLGDEQAEAGAAPMTSAGFGRDAAPSANPHANDPRDPGGYDEALADSCFRKGVAELDQGQLEAALASLRAAARACPPQHRAALAKIQQVVNVARSRLCGHMV